MNARIVAEFFGIFADSQLTATFHGNHGWLWCDRNILHRKGIKLDLVLIFCHVPASSGLSGILLQRRLNLNAGFSMRWKDRMDNGKKTRKASINVSLAEDGA